MLRTSAALALALVAIGITAHPSPARAQAEPAEAVETARADFVEGQGHFRAKRWAEALRSFERSYGAVASPNAQLMIARCLRELGRSADAATAFASAEAEARRRAARGESRYAETAEAAASEGAALRRAVGTLKIRVSGSATLTVDGRAVPLRDGDATVFHEPGAVQVGVRDSAGAEQRQSVVLTGGHTVTMEFSVEPKAGPSTPPAPQPPRRDVATARDEAKSSPPGWMLPAALVAGGVTLAGAGVFAGFGLSSRSTYDELYARCGRFGACAADDRAQADAGQRSQTIANIGLGVAIAGAVATAVIVYLGLSNPRVTASTR